MLPVEEYRELIALDEPWPSAPPGPLTPTAATALLDELVRYLAVNYRNLPELPFGADRLARRGYLQSVLTRLPAAPPLPAAFHAGLDRLLQYEQRTMTQVEAASLPRLNTSQLGTRYPAATACALWQGDITRLRIDAIVNAANAELLGCFQPFHRCIDNAIHCAAGPRLREDCHTLMQAQGAPEVTGTAKITRAYNLPSRYVLHTVGPSVTDKLVGPTPAQRAELASCYTACLDLTLALPKLRSVAFCGISTGVFGFPAALAAPLALATVANWLRAHPDALDLVVFNVFSDFDRLLYEMAITNWK